MLIHSEIPKDAEHGLAAGLQGFDAGFSGKDLVGSTDGLHLAEPVKDPHGDLVLAVPFLPREFTAVEVTGIVTLQSVFFIGIVVFLADLVAGIDDRNTALDEKPGMEHQVAGNGFLNLCVVALVQGGFKTAEGCRGAAKAGVPETRIVVVQFTSGIAAVPVPGQIIVQELLMRDLLDTELMQPFVIQAPADVVVAAQIILENIFLGKRGNLVQLALQKAHVAGSYRIPGGGHGGHVVKDVAFRLFHGAEVRDDLGGLHNHFAQKKHAGADDLADDAHHADQSMHLRQVPAVGSQLLPDIRNGVQTDHVDAAVGKEQHVGRHVVEDHAVGVVQIPLIRIEGGHDDLTAVLKPGKVARRRGREDFGHGLFIHGRNVPAVVEIIAGTGGRVSFPGQLCPGVLLAGMIHDKVESDADAGLVAVGGKLFKILHGAELRLDLPEIGNRISAVVLALGTVEERHQMEIIHAAAFDVVKLCTDSLQRVRKQVGIHHHAQHVVSFVPGRVLLPLAVQPFQGSVPFLVKIVHGADKPVQRVKVFSVKRKIKPFQFVITLVKAFLEFWFPFLLIQHSILSVNP